MPHIESLQYRLTRDRKQLGLLVYPSWLSGLLIVVISLGLTVGIVGLTRYQGSSLQYLVQLQDKPAVTGATNVKTDDTLAEKVSLENLPLFIFWAGVGLVAYWFATSIIAAFQNANQLRQQLDYVNADRNTMLREAVGRLLFRLVALGFWCAYVYYTIHVLLPYVTNAAYAASGADRLWINALYCLWAASLLAIGLHLHVVCLRLLAFRSRLFSKS